MKEFKGIKGKRKAIENPIIPINYITQTEDGKVIAHYSPENFETDEEMIATARLDAAAPDLLKALQTVIECATKKDFAQAVIISQEAINKALGQ